MMKIAKRLVQSAKAVYSQSNEKDNPEHYAQMALDHFKVQLIKPAVKAQSVQIQLRQGLLPLLGLTDSHMWLRAQEDFPQPHSVSMYLSLRT